MKKLKFLSIVLALASLFCVPAFAADSVCDHLTQTSLPSSIVCLYSDTDHYLYCISDNCIIPVSVYVGTDILYPHTDGSCSVCTGIAPILCFPMYIYEDKYFECSMMMGLYNQDPSVYSELVTFYYDSSDHYLCCRDCGRIIPFSFVGGQAFPHTSDDCGFCTFLSSFGSSNLGRLPVVLPAVTKFLTSAVGWITAFVLCIVTNPLLLIFVVSIFVILGLYLLKRSIRL